MKLNDRKSVAIYGTEEWGRQLYSSLRNNVEYFPRFFIDENPENHNTRIGDLYVYNFNKGLEYLQKYKINIILIAIPNLSIFEKEKY